MGLVSGLSNFAGVDLRSAKTKMREREARQRAVVDDLAADLIRAIDANAPDFKYIHFQVFSGGGYGSTEEARIVTAQDKELHYRYIDHGFRVSDKGKEMLSAIIAEHYGALLHTQKKDISRDSRSLIAVMYYLVIAHAGIEEYRQKMERQRSIRSC